MERPARQSKETGLAWDRQGIQWPELDPAFRQLGLGNVDGLHQILQNLGTFNARPEAKAGSDDSNSERRV